jgi:hypothetical protein
MTADVITDGAAFERSPVSGIACSNRAARPRHSEERLDGLLAPLRATMGDA